MKISVLSSGILLPAQHRLDNGSDVQEVHTFIEYVNGETDLGRYEIVDGVILLIEDNG